MVFMFCEGLLYIYGAQNETYIEGWEKRHQTY